jgi:glycerophosphoryl diester phosphodiesterase
MKGSPSQLRTQQLPDIMRPSFLTAKSGKILNIAHRATEDHTSANALDVISETIGLGVDGIELDVQATRDGKLILFHDEFVRIGSKSIRVGDLSFAELTVLLDNVTHQPPRLARLEEALDMVSRTDTMILLDIKTRSAIAGVIEAIHEANVAARTSIASFDSLTLRRGKRLDASIPTMLTVGFSRVMRNVVGFCWTTFALAVPLLAVRLVGAEVILCPAFRITHALVRAAHRAGIAVIVWRIAEYDRLRELVTLGVDGFVNDVPLMVRRELEIALN